MEYAVLVAERGALQELVHEAPNGDRIQCTAIAVCIHVLLQVAIAKLEDEDELTHYGQSLANLDDFDNVGLGLDDEEEEDLGMFSRK